MIIEGLIGIATTINLGAVGYLVRRQENTKKELLELRNNDFDHFGQTLSEIKADIREIFKILANKEQ